MVNDRLIVKCANRTGNENIGDYLYESLYPAAVELGIELVRLPDGIHNRPDLEVEFVNGQAGVIGFLFYSHWGTGRKVGLDTYRAVRCPVIFWTREDPNHFDHFLPDAAVADLICTSALECVPKYHKRFPDRQVICLPMAIDPGLFAPNTGAYSDREYDLVFVGNRYPKRDIRLDGENALIVPAAQWAIENGKSFDIFGLQSGTFSWEDLQLPGVTYHDRTDRLKAALVYRNAKVALSVASNTDSLTMAPNRVVQIAATGTVLASYTSKATEWTTGGNANISRSAPETGAMLTDIFNDLDKYAAVANQAREHVLKYHTFKHRIERITGAINGL